MLGRDPDEGKSALYRDYYDAIVKRGERQKVKVEGGYEPVSEICFGGGFFT